jgi:hypothetical protein
VLPRAFVKWVLQLVDTAAIDLGKLCAAADVPRETWDFAYRMLHHEYAIDKMQAVWWRIVLADREKLKHEVESINIIVSVTWRDQTPAIHQRFTHASLLPPGSRFSDATVVDFAAEGLRDLLAKLASQTMDVQHDAGIVNVVRSTDPDDVTDPYEVYTGWVLKGIEKIRPELREGFETYFRWAQRSIRPVVGQAYREQAEAHHAAHHAARKERAEVEVKTPPPSPVDEIRGGWEG